ncbi:DUF559 domain-containing protein [Microbacterium sp. AZCO]|uniref:endonuclease domain-containing protein n=1 Tax=Microbacterium sp. AZCO TaxID=3142976 RepID=UPI0031F40AE4
MATRTATRRTAALDALEAEVRRRRGVARASSLQLDGHSRHYLRLAVDARMLHRVRRDWLAVTGADPDLVSAARRGVVLSCATRAARLGLWVMGDEGEHVAAGGHDRVSVTADTTVHWTRPVIARHPDLLEDSIENTLALIAICQPRERALVVWESALNRGMVERPRLERLDLPPVARRMLEEARPHADSGLETIFVTRLRRFGVSVRSQIWIAGHHVDHLIGERLVFQIDGGHHVGMQRTSDIAHDAALRLLGFTVFRVGYAQVIDDWPYVQWLAMEAMAQGLHRAA